MASFLYGQGSNNVIDGQEVEDFYNMLVETSLFRKRNMSTLPDDELSVCCYRVDIKFQYISCASEEYTTKYAAKHWNYFFDDIAKELIDSNRISLTFSNSIHHSPGGLNILTEDYMVNGNPIKVIYVNTHMLKDLHYKENE